MKGLLTNAVYTAHANNWKSNHSSSTILQRFQDIVTESWDILEASINEKDLTPLFGTTFGVMLGSCAVGFFFWFWYCVLLRYRRNSKQREYATALGMMSRPTSDDSQYKHLRQSKKKQKRPSLWKVLLQKTSVFGRGGGDELPRITGPACYLVWEPAFNGGQLVQFYSRTPIDLDSNDRNIVGIWKPKSHISSSKFENGGRTILSRNCSVGFQGKHNYCHGICLFLKSTFPCGGGSVTLLENADVPVDVYLYLNETRKEYQTLPLAMRKSRVLPSNSLAVACLPASTPFHKNVTVDMYMWLADGERKGSSTRF